MLEKDKKYGGIDAKGNMLIPVAFDGIYSTISEGKTMYHILYNGQEYDAIEYINLIKQQLGIYDEEEENEQNNSQEDTNTVQDTNVVENNEEQSSGENTNSVDVSDTSNNSSENTENSAE